jgi:FG-GAP repeat protein
MLRLLSSLSCLSLIASGSLLSAQQDYSVGGEWEPQFIYAPNLTQPPMNATNGLMNSVGDLDGDGMADLVFVSESNIFSYGGLFCVSGATGSELWNFSYALALGISITPYSSFARIPDQDGDGVPELLAGESSYASGQPGTEGILFLHSGRTGDLIWYGLADDYGASLSRGVAGLDDVNGDGIADFAFSTGRGLNWNWTNAVHILSGADQSLILRIQHSSGNGPNYGQMSGLDQKVDADGDGVADFLVADSPNAEMISPVTGSTLYTVTDCRLAKSAGSTQVAVIDDLDGDGIPEYVTPLALTGGVACRSGQTGLEIWRRELSADAGTATKTIPDLNGDGFLDLAVGAPNADIANYPGTGKINFLSGLDGKRIRRLTSGSLGLANEDRLGGSLVYDYSSEILFVREAQPYGATLVGPLIALKFNPFLIADVSSLSSQFGGSVQFTLDFPADHAGQLFALAVSGFGGKPTVVQDVKVPLASSPLLQASIQNTLPPVFPGGGRIGILNQDGDGTIQMSIPAGMLASRVGTTLYFAAVVGPTSKDISLSSVAVPIEVTL